MENHQTTLIRYHEIALKGANQGWFEKKLAENSKKMILRSNKKHSIKIERKNKRILFHHDTGDFDVSSLKNTFGISSYSKVNVVDTSIQKLQPAVILEMEKYINEYGMPKTFRVKTRRSDKALPEKSMELDLIFGSKLKELYPQLKVQLKDPECTIGVEIRRDNSYVWSKKIPGPGGLPVGTNGKLLTLLSGGIDSPVAAIHALKRGCNTALIHFSGEPFVEKDVIQKIKDLAKAINNYSPGKLDLYIVPFGKTQEQIALQTEAKFRTVLYRRLMMKIATKVAKNEGFLGIVTGESLGQVASQTLENIAVINESTSLPIIRPLITYDKDQIIKEAKQFNTYEISIKPFIDCCTLFADRHPIIRAELDTILEQEKLFLSDELIEQSLKNIIKH